MRFTPLLVLAVAGCAKLPVATATVPAPAPLPTPTPEDSIAAAGMPLDDESYLRVRGLVFPVAGGDPSRTSDSFDAPRSGGRRHGAIDILAPRGTPVLSADDGRILRLSTNSAGGITIYAADPASRIVYYYAHLDGYHASLYTGKTIVRGDTLGYVGTTGNAPRDVPHLHFQIMRMAPDGRYWSGEPINPFPLLMTGAAAGADRRID